MNTILRYLEEMSLTMLLLLPGWALVRWLYLRRKGEEPCPGREVLLALFVLYLAALAQQTVLPQIRWAGGEIRIDPWDFNGCNYIPLYTIRRYFLYASPVNALVNLAGNVLVFAPLGLLPPLLWKPWRRFFPTLILGGLCSLFIEVVQPLVGRSRDIDDLILNTLGCAAGYLFFVLFRCMRKRL